MKRRNQGKMARNNENMDRSINRLVEGTKVNGEITSEGNIRIDGDFEGTIRTKGRLVIGPKGTVSGTIVCQNSEVEGQLKGKIQVDELLSLKASAKVEGEIHYGQLSIEPGALFAGTCYMGSKIKEMSQVDSHSKTLEEQTA